MAALLAAWLLVELQRRAKSRAAPMAVAFAVATFAFIGVSNGTVNQDAPWYGQEDTGLPDLTADDLSMRSYLESIAGVRMASDWALYRALKDEVLAPGSSIDELSRNTWPPGVGPGYEVLALREVDYQRPLGLPAPIGRRWWLLSAEPFARIYASGTGEVWLRRSDGR
jgi:hypothetical protein